MVKHVFVETNFIIETLRPFPTQDAEQLLARNGVDVKLHLPWCSVTEAKRTLERIIREDLAFPEDAGRYVGRLQKQHQGRAPIDAAAVNTFINMARDRRLNALSSFVSDVDALAAQVQVIPPSPSVVTRTLSLFPVKSLPPFDEMVLGAVLTQAGALHASGETALYFCNLNTKDFTPTTGNKLGAEYAAVGLQYLDSFKVP
ncbi:MAG TPA: hypothetical protein PK156_13785 [Polyangium sp.]|nr:hypothetical protein [Polyangium sp.]